MLEKNDSTNLKKYFILTYLLFWILLGFTGFLISLDVPLIIQNIIKNICAWSPSFVILIMFKKLYPNTKFRDYLRKIFRGKTNSKYFIVAIFLQSTVFVVSVLAYLAFNNFAFETITLISVTNIIPVLIMCLTGGAIGEELGWREYALNTFQKKYTPLKSSLIVGLVWGFWHLPLMLLSGYSGLELIYYIIGFVAAIVSLSVVITFFYNKDKNILIAMWIHFLFNFLLQLVIIDLLQLIVFIAAGYMILAIFIILLNRSELLTKKVEII